MACQRGLSILELLLTLVVLGTGLMGLTRLLRGALASAAQARQRQQALLLARGALEASRAGTRPLQGRTWASLEGMPWGEQGSFYGVQTHLLEVPAPLPAGLRLLEVRVTWREGSAPRGLALRALVPEGAP